MRQEVNENNFSESVAIVPPIENYYDGAANDSDKSWTVPNNELWKLCHACIEYEASATIGNRIITLEVRDENSNIIKEIQAGAVQFETTTVRYCFLQGICRETLVTKGALQVPIPADMYITGGSTLRLYDSASVAATADDMTVAFQIEKYKV